MARTSALNSFWQSSVQRNENQWGQMDKTCKIVERLNNVSENSIRDFGNLR